MSDRKQASLACSVCGARNYRITKNPQRPGQFELKKFCPSCNQHTLHRETK